MGTKLLVSLGRLLPLSASLVALALSCSLTTASVAVAASTGTLVVEIELQRPMPADDGYRVWVYLGGEINEIGTKELFASGEINSLTRFQGEVLAGTYRFVLVGIRKHLYGEPRYGVVANRACRASAQVRPGTVTTVRLDWTKGCFIPEGKYQSSTVQVELHSATAELLRTKRFVEGRQNKCAEQSAPFFDIYNKIRAEPPKKPVILIPEKEIGLVTGRINSYNTDGLNVYGLEFDADQVRNLVRYLKFYCWEGGSGIDKNGFNSQERQLAEILDQTVLNEEAKIEQLNGIADILDNVTRRQKR